jgi:hypothetical protein
MRRLWAPLGSNSQILHRPMIAVKHDVAMEDEVAGEALKAGAESDAQDNFFRHRV